MVRLTITTTILRALKQLQKDEQVSETGSHPPLVEPDVGKPISHEQILSISARLRQHIERNHLVNTEDVVSWHLDDLLRGSQVYIEPPKPPNEPTTEYKTLMVRLRREEEERVYQRMINPPLPVETFSQRFPQASRVDLFRTAPDDVSEDEEITYADINRQMALIINIVISIIACSVAIWLAARHWGTASRLGLSMGGSGAVAVAEAVVYAGYLRRLKEAREKGRKEPEIKEIIKTWVIGAEEEVHEKDIKLVKSEGSRNGLHQRRRGRQT